MEEVKYKFNCELCNYNTNRSDHFKRHNVSAKHIYIKNGIISNKKSFICACGKHYMSRQGLYIHKKGKILMLLTMLSATVNVILNVILIPKYGITGAAIATLVSFVLLATSNKIISSKIFDIAIPWISILKFGIAAAFMYATLSQIIFSSMILTLVLQIVTGAIIYSILVLLIDVQTRDIAKDYYLKIRNR